MAMENAANQKAIEWIVGRDTGASSKALWATMMGQKSDGSHPHDPGDLGRCLRLLKMIPEWKTRLAEMGGVSPYWSALVEVWATLEALMLEEMGPNFDTGFSAKKTNSLMTKVLRPIEDADETVFRMGKGMTIKFGA